MGLIFSQTLDSLVMGGPITTAGTSGGIVLSIGSPGVTTNTLYNNSGVLSFNGSAVGGSLTLTDDTTTNATYYPVLATTAGGSTLKTSSTKLSFNTSSGALTIGGNTYINSGALFFNGTGSTWPGGYGLGAIDYEDGNGLSIYSRAGSTYALSVFGQSGGYLLNNPIGTNTINFPGGVASTTTTSGTLIVTGGVGVDGAINSGSLTTGAATVTSLTTGTFTGVSTATLTTTAVTAGQVISILAVATYRSCKYVIQAVDATGAKYHSTEILAVHDGTTPSYTEYASVYTANGVCGTFSVDINTGNMRLLVTPSSANSTVFKVTCNTTLV